MQALQILDMGVEIAVGTGVAVAAFLFLLLRKWFPALRVAGGPVEVSALRRAERAEAELENANLTIAEQDAELEHLRRERNLATVIALVEDVAGGVKTMLEKMGELNGSLTHTREGLEQAVKAIQASTTAIEYIAGQMHNRAV